MSQTTILCSLISLRCGLVLLILFGGLLPIAFYIEIQPLLGRNKDITIIPSIDQKVHHHNTHNANVIRPLEFNKSLVYNTSQQEHLVVQLINIVQDQKYIYNHRNPFHEDLHFTKLATFVDLAPDHIECFHDLYVSRNNEHKQCQLPVNNTNTTITIHNRLGHGQTAIVYNVSIHGTLYALKMLHGRCAKIKKEYAVLKAIEAHPSARNISLNVAYVHPYIPGYCYEDTHHIAYCFAFMEQIVNVISWHTFISHSEKYLSSIVETQGNIFTFALNCYNDLMNITHALFDMEVAHNDITEGNIVMDTNTFKCYLIDYGEMIYLQSELFLQKRRKGVRNLGKGFKCLPHSCSPIGHYYIQSARQRTRFRKMYYQFLIYGQKEVMPQQILSEFVLFDKQYVITTFVFHAMIELYCVQNVQNMVKLCELNQEILEMSNKEMHMKTLDYIHDDDIYAQQWCKRHQVIDMLKGNNLIPAVLWNILHILEIDLLFLNKINCRD